MNKERKAGKHFCYAKKEQKTKDNKAIFKPIKQGN